MPPELHEDFGEKIGGAKKDLWKDRGLYTDDLDGMNEREAEKYVKKDNVWKKPDYQAMLDEGTPLGVVFYMKKARDSLNASPQYPYRDNTPEKRLDRQKQYVETVRELQAVVEGVRTVEDVMQVCDRFFLDNGYLEKRHGYGSTPAYQGTKKGSDNPVITNKLFRALRVHSLAEFKRDYTRQAQKEQFGVAKEQLEFLEEMNKRYKEVRGDIYKAQSVIQMAKNYEQMASMFVKYVDRVRDLNGKQISYAQGRSMVNEGFQYLLYASREVKRAREYLDSKSQVSEEERMAQLAECNRQISKANAAMYNHIRGSYEDIDRGMRLAEAYDSLEDAFKINW